MIEEVPGIECSFADGCLRLRMLNDDLLTRMGPTVLAIAGLIKHHAPKVTFIDLRNTPKPATFNERFNLGELSARYLSGRPIAVLARPNQIDNGHIAKVVANNRGALIEVFSDETAAEAWIRQWIGAKGTGG